MLFRRAQFPYIRAEVAVHGLDPQATYRLRNGDAGTEQTATGAELAKRLSVETPMTPGSVLLRYQRQ